MSPLKRLFRDPLFFRVCLALWSLPLLSVGIAAVLLVRPTAAFDWVIFALLLAIGGLGSWLAYAAVFGNGRLFDKATTWASEGADGVGLIVAVGVVTIAVPVTLLIRVFIPSPARPDPE